MIVCFPSNDGGECDKKAPSKNPKPNLDKRSLLHLSDLI